MLGQGAKKYVCACAGYDTNNRVLHGRDAADMERLTSKRSIARLTDLQIDQVFGKWRHLHRGGASSISAAGVAAPSRPESSAALSPREMPSTSVLSSAPRSSKKLIHKFPNTPVGLVVVSGQTGCRQALLSGHQPFPTDTRKLSGLLSCQTCQNA